VASRRALAVILLVGSTYLLLSTRAFVSFARIRVKVAQAPVEASGGSVRFATDEVAALARLGQPAALIVHVASQDERSGALTVTVDGMPVCQMPLPRRASRRADCAVTAWGPTDRHEIRIDGPQTPWTLTYLEAATHHGNTGGATYLVILPRGSSHYRAPSPAVALLVVVVFAALLLFVPATPFPRWAVYVHRALAVAAAAVLTAIQIAPWVSHYKVIVWTWTLALLLVVILLPRVWTAGRWLTGVRLTGAPGAQPRSVGATVPLERWKTAVRPAIVGAGVVAVFWMVMDTQLRVLHGGNYSGFLIIARSTFDANPLINGRDDIRRSLKLLDESGYDGQFMYYAAFDPLMRAFRHEPARYRSVVDAVPYRFGRIGFSALTRLIAGERWRWYPATMMWIILLSLGASAFALATMAEDARITPLAGALVLLVPGFWRSMLAALPEPLAAATLLAGILAAFKRRWGLAGSLFAVSLLVRETGVVLVTCIACAIAFSGRCRDAATVWLVAIAPALLWRIYVGWTIYPDWGVQGFFDRPVEFGWPFGGLLDLWRVIDRSEYFPGSPKMARAGLIYPVLLVTATVIAGLFTVRSPQGGLSIAALAYAVAALSLNYRRSWVDVGNSERVTYELFVVLAVLAVGIPNCPRLLRIALIGFWCATGAYTLYGAYDAEVIRRVLGMPG
jgi:hypothetical protein